MGTESLLNDYLTRTRAAQERAEASEVIKRVEQIFEELGLPWKRDGETWSIDSDVGEVLAGLDDDEEVLSLWHIMFPIDKPPKKGGELFWEMLCANAGTTGACFAIRPSEDDVPAYAFVVGRISAKSLDPAEVALALSSVFELVSVGR